MKISLLKFLSFVGNLCLKLVYKQKQLLKSSIFLNKYPSFIGGYLGNGICLIRDITDFLFCMDLSSKDVFFPFYVCRTHIFVRNKFEKSYFMFLKYFQWYLLEKQRFFYSFDCFTMFISVQWCIPGQVGFTLLPKMF